MTTTEEAFGRFESRRQSLGDARAFDEVVRDFVEAEILAYKQRVRATAESYARRHGWCDEVQHALRELDVPRHNDASPPRVGAPILRLMQLQALSVGSILKDRSTGEEFSKTEQDQFTSVSARRRVMGKTLMRTNPSLEVAYVSTARRQL